MPHPRVISVFTGSRAEFGLLMPILEAVNASDDLDLQLLVGGTHLDPAYGDTAAAIDDAGFDISHRIVGQVAGDSAAAVARTSGLTTIGVADVLERSRPSLLLLLGDRYETLAAGLAATITRVPVAHVHGGEISEGAVDDAFRHALTKLAHLHFVAAEPFRQRLIQMGEQPSRVHTVGAPGIAHLKDGPLLTADECAKRLGFVPSRPFFLATYHPETLAADGGQAGLTALLAALDAYPSATVLFTGTNADPMRQAISRQIAEYVEANPDRAFYRQSLGQTLYTSLLFHADVVVGNSSSGIIEAPAAKTPSVDVGGRQAGRLRSFGVIHADPNCKSVSAALARALSQEHIDGTRGRGSVFGDGHAGPRISAIIEQTDLPELLHKRFHDMPTAAAAVGGESP